MEVNNNPRTSISRRAIIIRHRPSPARRRPRWRPRSRSAVEAAVRGVNGVDEINSSVARATATPSSSSRSARRPTARSTTCATRSPDPRRPARRHPRAAGQSRRHRRRADPVRRRRDHRHDARAAELVRRQYVAKRLLGVEGIAAVTREGGVDREIRVILDPAALQAQGITAAQVNQQLRQTNLNAAGGRAEIAGSEQSVRVLGNARTPTNCRRPRSRSRRRFVKLADLGQVKDAYSEQRTIAKMNGRQVISFNVQRAKGASEVTAYDAGLAELRKIEKENPRPLHGDLQPGRLYQGAIYSAMEGLIEGAILAVFVVFLFLRDIRATLISALAIPLSAIPAFWFMSLMGFTLNGLIAAGDEPGRRACWSTTRSSRSRTSSATCAWANRPIRRRSTPPTRSASRCSRRPWRSSRCSCRSR
jgi:hypothetical protein